MSLIQAEKAALRWDAEKHRWVLRIAVGEEVIKRSAERSLSRDTGEEILRNLAIETAKDEGYSIRPEEVSIERE